MLGTFSFEPYFKSYRCFTVGSLEFLEITLSPSPTSLLCSRRRPPTAPPPASWRVFPAINSPRAGTHASRRSSSTALLPRAGAPSLRHAAQNHLAAATATPPWRARCTTPARQLARAPSSGEPLHSIPLVPTLFSRLHIPEHPHRPLNAGEQWLTAEPRFHSCSARAYPAFSTARTSRISLTSSRRPSSTRTPSRRAPP